MLMPVSSGNSIAPKSQRRTGNATRNRRLAGRVPIPSRDGLLRYHRIPSGTPPAFPRRLVTAPVGPVRRVLRLVGGLCLGQHPGDLVLEPLLLLLHPVVAHGLVP